MTALRLFHYTCTDHGQPGIEPGGLVLPNRHPLLPARLAWFTDLVVPYREALGLTSYHLLCDRTAVRYEVHPDVVGLCIPWLTYASQLDRSTREALEGAPGTLPRHWWVTEQPILVLVSSAVVR